jgi:four helix bundle protein
LGERYLRKVQVGGSSPLCSRNLPEGKFLVHRSQKTENGKFVVFTFENLNVCKDALSFSKDIYKLTKEFPKDEIFGLTSQLRRAAASGTLNIAEGSGLTKSEFNNFLRRARGSLYECIPILGIALDAEYISEEEYRRSYSACNSLARSISALMKTMR